MRVKKFNEMASGGTPIVKDFMTKKWISYPPFKKQNIKNFGELFKSVYEPIGHWEKRGYGGGVVGLEWDSEHWSILNRINTNYSSLSSLINSLNEYVIDKGEEPFDFFVNKFGTASFYKEYNRMIDYLKDNAQELLLKMTKDGGSKVINDTISPIRITKGVGDFGEKLVTQYLPQLNKDITNIKVPEGSGDMTDMVGGADVLFDYNGKTYTIQVKKIKYAKQEEGVFKTFGASIAKQYNVDYYALVDKFYVRFFKNDQTKIKLIWGGELEIDESLLVKSFRYKKWQAKKK